MHLPRRITTLMSLVVPALVAAACHGPLISPSGTLSIGFVPSANAIPVGGTVVFAVSAARPGNPANIFIDNIRVDFGDGAVADLGAATRGGTLGAEGQVSHTYLNAGAFTATASATDSLGTEARSSQTIVVSPGAVSVGLITNASNPTPVGSAVTFTVNATVPGTVPGTSGDAIRAIRLDFGDGQIIDLGASPPSAGVSHIYTTSGTYVATATATSLSGAQGRASATIVVSGTLRSPTPSVGLTTTAANPVPAGTAVQFSVTASIPGGTAGITIRNIHLDFGDGQSADLGAAPSGPVSHNYARGGTYTATATAIDTSGNQGSASITVVVSGVAATPTPSVGLTSNAGNPVPVGTAIQFNVTVSLPGAAGGVAIRQVRLEFGDGQSADLGAAPTQPVSHTYAQPGTYSATATAIDTNGNLGSASLTVVVR
jgi:PKD repeat protein